MNVTIKAGPFSAPVFSGGSISCIEIRDENTTELLRLIQFPGGGNGQVMITSTKGDPDFQMMAAEAGVPIFQPPGFVPGSIIIPR